MSRSFFVGTGFFLTIRKPSRRNLTWFGWAADGRMVVQLLNCMHVCRFGVVDSTASKGHSFQKQYKHYAVIVLHISTKMKQLCHVMCFACSRNGKYFRKFGD